MGDIRNRGDVMGTYFMSGKCQPESIKEISGKRTEKAVSLMKRLGGRIQDVYTPLGPYDLALIVDFPRTQEAMKVEDFGKIATGP